MDFSTIVKNTREQNALSVADFCTGINQVLPVGEQYTIQMIYLWERGKHQPPLTRLDFIRNHAPEGSWQRAFGAAGVDCVSVQQITAETQSPNRGISGPPNGVPRMGDVRNGVVINNDPATELLQGE